MEQKYRTVPRQSNLAHDIYTREMRSEIREETRILREPEKTASKAAAPRISYGYIFAALAVAVMFAMVVMSYAKLSELNIRSAALQREMTALQKEYTAILAAQDREYNLSELAEYAENHLGMTRATAENVIYIDLGEADEIRLADGTAAKTGTAGAKLRNAFDTFVEYFR